MSICSINHSTMFRGSDKNRSSPYKEGIWRNGDCHDVGLRVLNFTHPERCAVTRSWSYEGMTHSQIAAQDCPRRAVSGTGFWMHTMQLDQLKVKHNFVVVDRLVVPVFLGVDFLQKNGLTLPQNQSRFAAVLSWIPLSQRFRIHRYFLQHFIQHKKGKLRWWP